MVFHCVPSQRWLTSPRSAREKAAKETHAQLAHTVDFRAKIEAAGTVVSFRGRFPRPQFRDFFRDIGLSNRSPEGQLESAVGESDLRA
jgi:hypothetical protein